MGSIPAMVTSCPLLFHLNSGNIYSCLICTAKPTTSPRSSLPLAIFLWHSSCTITYTWLTFGRGSMLKMLERMVLYIASSKPMMDLLFLPFLIQLSRNITTTSPALARQSWFITRQFIPHNLHSSIIRCYCLTHLFTRSQVCLKLINSWPFSNREPLSSVLPHVSDALHIRDGRAQTWFYGI